MPAGVVALRRMGVDIPADARAAFRGIRYIDGNAVAEGRFAHGVGWGIRRTALVESLAARARALGADLRYQCAAGHWRNTAEGILLDTESGPVHGSLLVGADGLHSRVRKLAGLECRWRGPLRFGLRRHFVLPPWSSFVEVYWGDGAEAYITPAGPERVAVAFLWSGGLSLCSGNVLRAQGQRHRPAEPDRFDKASRSGTRNGSLWSATLPATWTPSPAKDSRWRSTAPAFWSTQ